MLDRARRNESLAVWAARNRIDLADESPDIVGYWCRVSGVSVADEAIRRGWSGEDLEAVKEGWRDADDDIADEIAEAEKANAETKT